MTTSEIRVGKTYRFRMEFGGLVRTGKVAKVHPEYRTVSFESGDYTSAENVLYEVSP